MPDRRSPAPLLGALLLAAFALAHAHAADAREPAQGGAQPPALVERGVASWYGRRFHGQLTASGERFDMHAFSAAHRRMPLPSLARVRNLANGRELVVRVNDRGPFHRGRVIDLSYAAARQLGVLRRPARVEVRWLGDAPPVDAPR